MFRRRLGPDPHSRGGLTAAGLGCPDIWELDSGDIAIIGLDKTAALERLLPGTASCGPDERIVVLPRASLLRAKSDIWRLR